ncbi:MAG TPA: deoxyribose-phosphate aldolase [Puia sp.]|nr:deoxyribose-phosphate aldolase [Puia sp.]
MLARYIDHTLLKPTAAHIEIEKICGQVVEYGFAAACVPPPFVALAHRLGVRTATVIGFPFGYSASPAKLAEAEQAIADGADELDVVVNLILLKDGKWAGLAAEMNGILDRTHAAGKLLKVIIETGVLTDAEIVRCCRLYGEMGVDFVKTSTGYAERGATVEAVRLMRANLPEKVRIKASGGIRDARFALELIAAGADRLGCSASVNIVREDMEARRAALDGGAVAASGGRADFY